MSRAVREYLLTVLLLTATILACFYPLIFCGRSILPTDLIDTMTLPFSKYYGPQHAYNSFITDGYLQFYPLKYFTKLAYEHGYFAFWNPYILNGYPQYLEGMWTYNFVLFLPMKVAFPLILLLPLLVSGVGMYALLREYGIRIGIARIFATAYMLNALFMTYLLAHFIPASFSFAPWVLLFLHRYYRLGSLRELSIAAIALALGFLAGNVQTMGFLLIFAGIALIALWRLNSDRSWKRLIYPGAMLFGLSLAMSAIYWLPALQLMQEVSRSGAFFSTSLFRSYTVLQRLESLGLLLTFFIPQLAGSVRGVMLQQAAGVFVQDFEGAIGFLPLLLAVAGSATLWRRRPEIRLFVVLMLVGLVLPIATPLFRYLYHRFFVLFVFGACAAGAMELEGLMARKDDPKHIRKYLRWAMIILSTICAGLLLIAVASWIIPVVETRLSDFVSTRLRHISFSDGNALWVQARLKEAIDYWKLTRPEIIIGLLSSFAGLALAWWRQKIPSSMLIFGIWLLTTFQLVYFALLWFPGVDEKAYPVYPSGNEIKMIREMAHDSRVFTYRELDPDRQYVFLDNQNVVYGIRQASGYESLVPRSLYLYAVISHRQDSGLISPRLIGKFDCRIVISAKPLDTDSALETCTNGPTWIYRNLQTLPHTFLANSIRSYSSDSIIIRHLQDDSFSIRPAYFSSTDAEAWSPAIRSSDSVLSLVDEGNEIRIRYQSADSTYLVLSDTYYPDWNAYVEGVRAEVIRCNYAMRAVKVPPGEHEVIFRFEPPLYRAGIWIGSVGLLATVAIALLGLAKRSKGRSAGESKLRT